MIRGPALTRTWGIVGSIRARLTVTYAAALLGTMLVFTIVLWLARRAGSYDELQRYVAAESHLALNIIRLSGLSSAPGCARCSRESLSICSCSTVTDACSTSRSPRGS